MVLPQKIIESQLLSELISSDHGNCGKIATYTCQKNNCQSENHCKSYLEVAKNFLINAK